MPSTPSLLVRPGSPSTPQFVDIDCAGMDLGRDIELLVNDVVRAEVPVDIAGVSFLTFLVPAGPVRNALEDLTYCAGRFDDEGALLCKVSAGSNSMALRYKP